MIILGLNAYHADSAACLIIDGKLVAAAEEERFRRIKHWAGLPTKAIDYCLREARLNIRDVDHIAINRKPGVNNLRRLGFVATHWPSPGLMLQKIKNIRSAVSVKETLQEEYKLELKAELHQVEHHLAHLASAFLVSGFSEAACISIDGFGDFASTALGFGEGNEIKIDDRVYFPHSLGIFYSALTQFIGFPHYGDEYKVMGLAPYGDPHFIDPLREVLNIQSDGSFRLNLKYFRHHSDNVSYTWENCTPAVGLLYRSSLIDLLGPARQPNEPLEQRHKDLARSVQVTYEKAFLALLQALHKKRPCDNLALSGGCAMNSVANGKVYRRTPFKKMYLPAAAGDAGGAIGAAVIVLNQLTARGQRSEVSSQPGGTSSSRPPEILEFSPPPGSGSSSRSQKPDVRDQSGGTAGQEAQGKMGDGDRESEANSGQTSEVPPSPSSGAASSSQQSAVRDQPAPEVGAVQSAEGEAQSANATEIVAIEAEQSGRNAGEGAAGLSNPQSAIPQISLRPLRTAYLGPESTEEEIHALLDWKKKEISMAECALAILAVEEELIERTAKAIDDGKVVGWFQGRMEWGPRALGNRSILGDPRRADMKEILNSKIKRRESFRPFAPSILREDVSDWFEQDDDVPFMMEVFQIRAQKRSFIPAVTHVDGSGRLHTVEKDVNPRYHRLISQFKELTGVPIVLNTSFNENEPVVCYPEEALDCFLRTKMDLLVLGNFLIERKS
jgi:predicted NodU family carbamoyl transferase